MKSAKYKPSLFDHLLVAVTDAPPLGLNRLVTAEG